MRVIGLGSSRNRLELKTVITNGRNRSNVVDSHVTMNQLCIMKSFLILVALLAVPAILEAQSSVVTPTDITLRLSGTLQSRATFAHDDADRIGFGVRRARLRLFGELRENVRIFLQLEGSGASATFTDLRAEWDFADNTTLRVGRFVGAQPASMAITLHHEIDAIDRAPAADHWAQLTRGVDARDFGLEVLHKYGGLELRGFLHNGSNGQNLRTGIHADRPTEGLDKTHLNASVMVRYTPPGYPKSEIGVHAGTNPQRYGVVMAPYVEYSAHAYWGKKPGDQPTRLKADVIGLRRNDFGDPTMTGAGLFAGRLVREELELFGRLDVIDSFIYGNRTRTFITSGFTRKLTDWNNHLKLAWSMRTSEQPGNDPVHVVTAQWQVYF